MGACPRFGLWQECLIPAGMGGAIREFRYSSSAQFFGRLVHEALNLRHRFIQMSLHLTF